MILPVRVIPLFKRKAALGFQGNKIVIAYHQAGGKEGILMVHFIIPGLGMIRILNYFFTHPIVKHFVPLIHCNVHMVRQPVIGAMRPYLFPLNLVGIVPSDKIKPFGRFSRIIK